MAVGALEPQFYRELLERLGLEDTLPSREDPQNWPVIRSELAAAFASRSRDDWSWHFAGSDACVSPVLSRTEAPADPHLVARGTFADWQGSPTPAQAPLSNGKRPDLAPPSTRISVQEALSTWSRLR